MYYDLLFSKEVTIINCMHTLVSVGSSLLPKESTNNTFIIDFLATFIVVSLLKKRKNSTTIKVFEGDNKILLNLGSGIGIKIMFYWFNNIIVIYNEWLQPTYLVTMYTFMFCIKKVSGSDKTVIPRMICYWQCTHFSSPIG